MNIDFPNHATAIQPCFLGFEKFSCFLLYYQPRKTLKMIDAEEVIVPVSTNISSSTTVCSRSGHPPFTIDITYKCTTNATIWALYKHYSYRGNGCEIRHPQKKHRRIGPSHRHIESEDDTEIKFTELVRLAPGEVLRKSYTFDVSDDTDRLFRNDVSKLVVGQEYELGIRMQKWWWMFEDDLPPNLSTEEKKSFLYERPATEWQPSEFLIFAVTE